MVIKFHELINEEGNRLWNNQRPPIVQVSDRLGHIWGIGTVVGAARLVASAALLIFSAFAYVTAPLFNDQNQKGDRFAAKCLVITAHEAGRGCIEIVSLLVIITASAAAAITKDESVSLPYAMFDHHRL